MDRRLSGRDRFLRDTGTRGAVALLVLTPAIARAQEENVLFLFLFFPSVVVMASLAIRVWTWNASRAAKTRAFLAVALTTLTIFVLNIEGGVLPLVMRLGAAAFFLGIAAQFGVPAFVWWVCRRR
jgi:hypothetical protein